MKMFSNCRAELERQRKLHVMEVQSVEEARFVYRKKSFC